MKRKNQAQPKPPAPVQSKSSLPLTASEVGRRAGFSRQHASKLMAEGRTADEIIQSAKLRREIREQVRLASKADPIAPTELESTAYLQRQKLKTENALRALQLAERRGELMQIGPLQIWLGGCIVQLRGDLLALPEALENLIERSMTADPLELALHCRRWLDSQIRQKLLAVEQYARQRASSQPEPESEPEQPSYSAQPETDRE